MARLTRLIHGSTPAWITVLGLSGVGKTHLVAHTLEAEPGSIFVPLGEEHGDRDDRLTSSIEGRARLSDPERSASVEQVLARTRFLVIENGERLRPSERRELESWLGRHRNLRIVVTSRVATGAALETLFFLESLPVSPICGQITESPALRLLQTTLESHGGSHDERHLAEIAWELGGLPLALVLIAPTIATLGAAETLALLKNADAFEESSPLVQSLSVAWENTPPWMLEILRDLSTCEGACSLETVTVFAGARAAELVKALRSRSLIEVDRSLARVRFRIHPIVRKFVDRRTTETQRAEATARLDRHVLERASACWFGSSYTLDREWVVADSALIYGTMERVRSAASTTPEDLARAGLLALCMHGAGVPMRDPSAFAKQLSAPAVLRALGDRGECLLTRLIGQLGFWAGELESKRWLIRSQQLAREIGEGDGRAELVFSTTLQQCHRHLEERSMDQAGNAAANLRALLPQLAPMYYTGLAKAMDALSQRHTGDVDWLSTRLGEARRLVAEDGTTFQVAWLDSRLADLALDAGRLDEANVHAANALNSLEPTHPLHTYCASLVVMSRVAESSSAEQQLEQLAAQLEESGDPVQRYTMDVAELVLRLHQRRWSHAVTLTEGLLRTPFVDDASRVILGTGLAVAFSLEKHGARALDQIRSVSTLAETAAPIERFRRSVQRWLEGAPDEDSLRPIRPTALPFEATLIRAFLSGARSQDRKRQLVVGLSGAWVELPDGRRLALSSKPSMQRLLLVLVAAHPSGDLVSTDELFERAWPGESIRAESARNRVRVTLSRLRKAGFADLLERTSQGVRISPAVRIDTTTHSSS
ncbi:MAG: helix-turn-helix domain-containing protein [Deltaproteobacteria bacterium]|nr:helix-turn-helix domain-containing protein [Deltaproteobacteria bacterium]